MAYRTADHAMMLARRARDAENRYARTKKHVDLTEVISFSAAARNSTTAEAQPEERKGVPLGQKWDK